MGGDLLCSSIQVAVEGAMTAQKLAINGMAATLDLWQHYTNDSNPGKTRGGQANFVGCSPILCHDLHPDDDDVEVITVDSAVNHVDATRPLFNQSANLQHGAQCNKMEVKDARVLVEEPFSKFSAPGGKAEVIVRNNDVSHAGARRKLFDQHGAQHNTMVLKNARAPVKEPSDKFNIGDRIEIFSHYCQKWCPAEVKSIDSTNPTRKMLTVVFRLPGKANDEMATKILPIGDTDMRKVGTSVFHCTRPADHGGKVVSCIGRGDACPPARRAQQWSYHKQ